MKNETNFIATDNEGNRYKLNFLMVPKKNRVEIGWQWSAASQMTCGRINRLTRRAHNFYEVDQGNKSITVAKTSGKLPCPL
jgi:hypothetical protein